MKRNKLTVKQARERGILNSFTSAITGKPVFQADLCGCKTFGTAGQAVAAFEAACKTLNRPAE